MKPPAADGDLLGPGFESNIPPRTRVGRRPNSQQDKVCQHLPVAGRIAEGDDRAAADHHMNAFGLSRKVVVQQQLGLLGQERFAVLLIALFRPARCAHDLLDEEGRIGLILANLCSFGSSACPWLGRSRNFPASAVAGTLGRLQGAAPRSSELEPRQTDAR
jgi:hypothetical protein